MPDRLYLLLERTRNLVAQINETEDGQTKALATYNSKTEALASLYKTRKKLLLDLKNFKLDNDEPTIRIDANETDGFFRKNM